MVPTDATLAPAELQKGYFLPYQLAWIMDPSNCKVWRKSRRIGATYAESYKTVRVRNLSTARRDYWFSSADESAAAEFAQYCRKWCEIFEAVTTYFVEELEDETPDGKKFKFNNYVIEFPHNGSRINCMSSNPRRFRSKGGDVTLDEAAWHDDPEEMYSAAEPCTMWGYTLSILSTESYEGSFFDQLGIEARKVRDGELDPAKDNVLPWSLHYTPLTVAIEQGLAEKIYKLDRADETARTRLLRECRARARSADKFDREYMCIPSREASTLIPYDLYRKCQSSDCLGPAAEGVAYMGFDIGRKHDRTVFWVAEMVGDVLVTREVITLHDVRYPVQKQVAVDLIRKYRISRTCGDYTGKGDALIEFLQDDFGKHAVEPVTFSNPVKDHLASRVLSRMEDLRCRLPDRMEERDSFHSIRKEVTKTGLVRYDAARTDDGHADAFWAFALCCEAAGTAVSPLRCYTND